MEATNPFIGSFIVDVVQHISKGTTYGVDDGVVTDPSSKVDVYSSYLTEAEVPTRIYKVGNNDHAYPPSNELLFNSLSAQGRDLLLYILYNIPKGCDRINLSSVSVCKVIQCSRQRLSRGIKELVEMRVLAKKNNVEYWVNPRHIFRGNRLDFIKLHGESLLDVVVTRHSKK